MNSCDRLGRIFTDMTPTAGGTVTLNLHLTASVGVARLVVEGLTDDTEDAIWEAFNEAGGIVQCSAVNRATGYRRNMSAVSATTGPLDLTFHMDLQSQKAADAVHLRIPDLDIDLTAPVRPPTWP